MRGVFNDACALFVSDFLYKTVCCQYSFEMRQQVGAIQISTNNICFLKKIKTKLHKHH